jgi:hypothetical protein
LIKPAEGSNGCANVPEQWEKLWAVCEENLKEKRFA